MHIAGYTGFQSYGQKPYSTNKPGILEKDKIYNNTKRNIDEVKYLENYNRHKTINSLQNKDLTPSLYKTAIQNLKENKKINLIKEKPKEVKINSNVEVIKDNSIKNLNYCNIIENPLYDIKYIGNNKRITLQERIKEVQEVKNEKNVNNKNIRINKYPIQLNKTGFHDSKLPYNYYKDQLDTELINNYNKCNGLENKKKRINEEIMKNYSTENKISFYDNIINYNKYNQKSNFNNENIDKYKNAHHTKSLVNKTEYNFQFKTNELKNQNLLENEEDDLKKGTTKLTYHIPGYSGYIANEKINDKNLEEQVLSKNTRNTIIKENILENYNLKMPGYSGYIPKNIKNKNNIEHYKN